MRQQRSVLLFATGLLLLGLAGCAADSRQSSSQLPPASQIAQAPGETAQPPSGAAQEPGTVQPPPGTNLPGSPASAGEPSQAAQGEAPAGEVEERGVLRRLPLTTMGLPEISNMQSGPGFVGPTENITKVGRALQVRAKSVTTLVVVAPELVLTQQVTISIALGGYCPTRLTQTYASTGNHFLYNDCEGDGNPRRAFADITLTEPKPGGGIYTATIPGSVMLDPLYDVRISPLQFSLIENCDKVGNSEIYLWLYKPDMVGSKQEIEFLTKAGALTTFPQFAWARTEVSASAKLHATQVMFYEGDCSFPAACFYPGWAPPPFVNLVPGKTQKIQQTITDIFTDCRAHIEYTITYQLRWYPFL